ncbi:MAG: class I SAM-dependent methyltransferase [Magnetospirillum sp.]|nr:class I SAM-dependent methyltransferase [Magnetospirillum sp.]
MSRRIHDYVARGYNSGSEIIGQKNREVVSSIRTRFWATDDVIRVIDLGVGDGAFLEMLSSLPLRLEFTGVDISTAMLDLAHRRVPLTPVVASAAEAAEHAPAQAFDLVVVHFILAYVDPAKVLDQARRLLAPGGVISLVTSTNHAAIPLRRQIERLFRHSRNPLRRITAAAVDRGMARSHVPEDFEALLPVIRDCGLKLANRRSLHFPVVLRDAADAFHRCIEEGWTANVLHAPPIPVGAMVRLARLALKLFEYPYECVQVIEVLELEAAGRG